MPGNERDIAETLFFAVCGVVASAAWLNSQPVEYDDFPTVPIPAAADALAAIKALMREADEHFAAAAAAPLESA